MKYFMLLSIIISVIDSQIEEGFQSTEERQLMVGLDKFRKQNLDCHNYFRTLHQVNQLHESSQLNNYAQDYAEKLAQTDSFEHSGGQYGENLFYDQGQVNGNTACMNWYAENQFYDYTKNDPINLIRVGHFTQLVWRGSQMIGVGVATSKATGRTYIVAEYSPPGNIRDQYRQNVFISRFF